MRLINVHKLILEDFSARQKPPYAILSYTWGDAQDEISFADFHNPSILRKKPGFHKITLAAMEAKATGIDYIWVDTCCIDKSSSTELTFSINSMFQWYAEANICYAYLSDVYLPADHDSSPMKDQSPGLFDLLQNSRWFTRGWTLQELLAPEYVILFDANWNKIGNKASFRDTISSITGIEAAVLGKAYKFELKPFYDHIGSTKVLLWSTVMRWSSKRNTSRPEDTAYCLMGIFGVHMPLLYGEGEKRAFGRLQHDMVRRASSNSLLTWDFDLSLCIRANIDPNIVFPQTLTQLPILADTPRQFSNNPILGTMQSFRKQASDYRAWIVSNRGLELEILLITNEAWFRDDPIGDNGIQRRHDLAIAVLPFRLSSPIISYLGFLLSGNSEECVYNRISSQNGTATVGISGRLVAQAKSEIIWLSDEQVFREYRAPSARSKVIYLESTEFQVHDVIHRRCEWNSDDQYLELRPDIPVDFQEALVKVVANKRLENIFYLLISNSMVKPDNIPSSQPQSKHWHFRELGIAVVPNDLAQRLFNEHEILPQQVLQVKAQQLTIKTIDGMVNVSLRENVFPWDLLCFLDVTRIDDAGRNIVH
jgi:hypothetical protein